MSAHCTSAITPKEKSGRCSGFAVGIDILILAQWERADAHSIVVDPGERMRIAPAAEPAAREEGFYDAKTASSACLMSRCCWSIEPQGSGPGASGRCWRTLSTC